MQDNLFSRAIKIPEHFIRSFSRTAGVDAQFPQLLGQGNIGFSCVTKGTGSSSILERLAGNIGCLGRRWGKGIYLSSKALVQRTKRAASKSFRLLACLSEVFNPRRFGSSARICSANSSCFFDVTSAGFSAQRTSERLLRRTEISQGKFSTAQAGIALSIPGRSLSDRSKNLGGFFFEPIVEQQSAYLLLQYHIFRHFGQKQQQFCLNLRLSAELAQNRHEFHPRLNPIVPRILYPGSINRLVVHVHGDLHVSSLCCNLPQT